MLKVVREFIDKDTFKLARVGTYLTGKSEERENELIKKGLAIKLKETKIVETKPVQSVKRNEPKVVVEPTEETKSRIARRK